MRNLSLIILLVLFKFSGVLSQSELTVDDQIESSKKEQDRGDYTKALKIMLSAQASVEDENSLDALNVQYQIGKIYLSSGNKDKSLSAFFELLKKCSGNGNDEMEVDAIISVGFIYYGMGLYEKALKYYHKGLKLSEEIDYKAGIAMSINNVAAVLEKKKQYKKAKGYFFRAMEINKVQGNEQWLGINYMNVGIIEQQLNKLDSAIYWSKKADSLFTKIDDQSFKARTLMILAENYQEKGNDKLTLDYVKMADSIAMENDFYKTYQNSSNFLRDLCLAEGDTVKAFFHQKNSIEATDKKAKQDKVEYALGLEQKFILEKFEIERENENENYRRNQKMMLFLIVLGGLCVIMFIGRLRVKLKHVKRDRNLIAKDLDNQSKQLATKTIELAKRQQIISSHVSTIERTIETDDPNDKNAALNKLKKLLEKESNEDVISEFEMCFEGIHTDFYEKLNKQFPDLSRNERRLSAFLYLNMSSKEISEITGQRIPTIEVARTRLRKKLNINQTGISLSGFLTKMGSSV